MNLVFLPIKIFVREFYRLNVGFFLVVIGISVGFMRDVEHLALAQFFISNWFTLLIPITVWLVYSIKVIRFNKQTIKISENEICFLIPLLPARDRLYNLLLIASLQLAPASLYGIFLIMVSLKNNFYITALIIVFSLLILHIVIFLILKNDLVRFNPETTISKFKMWFDHQGARPYNIMIIGWLGQTKTFELIATKALGCMMLWGISQLYKAETYDLQLVTLGVIFSFSANILLLYHFHRFENYFFALCRNLPITFARRIIIFLVTITLLCLFEIGILTTSFTESITLPSSLAVVLFGLSMLVLYYGILFIKDWRLEDLMRKSFYLITILFLLILADVPSGLLAILNTVTGIWLWKQHQYTFECSAPVH